MNPDLGKVVVAFRLLLFLGFLSKGCWSIRVTEMWVPPVVVSGSRVRMVCNYEHRADRLDPLYSVKWYRGLEQFYQYMPKKKPQVKVFDLPYLSVDRNNSNQSTVVLIGVTKETSGTFRCEVVGEKPLFETDDSTRNMTVVDIPLWGPEIRGLVHGSRVRPGDIIKVQCLLGHSEPPVHVTWLINNEHLPPHALTTYAKQRDERARMAQVFTLELELENESFIGGAITLACNASLSTVYNKSTNVTLIHADHPQPSEFGWFSAGSSVRSSLVALAATLGLVCLLVV
ncbi:uncharacterized protein LOC135198144 [Macrobrachium nipponense]|uniref:uncharacterized protein LOC135198144 n=1 Tax=Macrobrachium nipponense TaxID=159736 RepID=UPI0030C83A19